MKHKKMQNLLSLRKKPTWDNVDFVLAFHFEIGYFCRFEHKFSRLQKMCDLTQGTYRHTHLRASAGGVKCSTTDRQN